jgi:hypothetical protein
MLVYRIEDQFGRGPYTGTNRVGSVAARISNNELEFHTVKWSQYHPPPSSDPLMREWYHNTCLSRYLFGFESIRSLIRWFPKKRWNHFATHEREWGVYTYEVDDESVVRGTCQVAFIYDDSRRLEKIIDLGRY